MREISGKADTLNRTNWTCKALSYLYRTAIALVLILMGSQAAQAAQQLPVRYGAIVMDYDSGNTLFSFKPDRVSYPASLTKVMTLYLLFDALDQGRLRLDSTMPVSAHATRQAPSRLGVKVGERISVEDAIQALVTKSANDIAVVIAEAVGGSEDAFAEMMTRKARAIGMANTTYRNASGLPNKGQVSSPRDQALLARAMIRNHNRYYHYFATRQFRWQGQTIMTHNRLMLRYEGADGIKTGYINASGFNLIASAKRDGRRLIGVVFGGESGGWRDNNMAQILDKGFARLHSGDTSAAEEADTSDVDDLLAATGKAPAGKRKPGAVAKAKNDKDDGWGIQVGNYSNYKQAQHSASAAAKRLGALGSHADVDVMKVTFGAKTQFRSRLNGFTESQARAACQRLSRLKQDCLIVKP